MDWSVMCDDYAGPGVPSFGPEYREVSVHSSDLLTWLEDSTLLAPSGPVMCGIWRPVEGLRVARSTLLMLRRWALVAVDGVDMIREPSLLTEMVHQFPAVPVEIDFVTAAGVLRFVDKDNALIVKVTVSDWVPCPDCAGKGYDTSRTVRISNDDGGTATWATCSACSGSCIKVES